MPQQQPSQQQGVNNSATNPSLFNNNNNRHGRTSTTRSNKNNTSPISLVNTNFQIPPLNGIIGNEKNVLIYQQQQQYQQEQQFGNHVINRQHCFQFLQPKMSVQYSNTNVPFQNTSPTHQHVIENNVDIGSNVNNTSPTTQSYFQSMPPEEFREIFLKKVFLGEDPNVDVCKTSNAHQQQAPILSNNIQHVIPSSKPSTPPNGVSQQHALYPNVHNSPVTSPTSSLIMQHHQQISPIQFQSNQHATTNANTKNATSNNEMAPLPPQQLENLTEQQLMEYILTWMTSVKTTNQ